MKTVLLNIVPEIIRERRYDRPHYPDSSLVALFAYLKTKSIPCHAIDSKLERLTLTEVIKRLKYFNPQVIGLTSFTHEIEGVARAAGIIKKEFRGVKLVVGGAHANALPGELLSEFPVFDAAISGEGEATTEELLKNNFENLESIRGIAFRKGDDVIVNQQRDFLDMRNIPGMDWSGFPAARYYPIFTSRGCSYPCIFCSRPFGKKVRYRPMLDVFEEMRQVRQLYHPRSFYFWDENFCADKPRVLELLARMRSDKQMEGVKWFCQAHVNNLDHELLKSMKESGCARIGIGIESGNETILKATGKGTTKKRVIQVVHWLRQVKIAFEGYFLLGLPNENLKTCLDTIHFAAKINPKFPVFGLVVPYPGTDIHAMAKQGRGGYKIIARRWKDYNKIIGNALELKGLSRKQLELLQFFGYAHVLIRNFRVFDMVRFLFQFHRDIFSCMRNFIGHRAAFNEE
jgi:radical SAM superfamily enzyme YgiQ (UPF0313 family)